MLFIAAKAVSIENQFNFVLIIDNHKTEFLK